MLEQWMSPIRNRFSGSDFEFLASILAPGGKRLHLQKLWQDPEAIREILDLKEVLRGMLDHPAAIQVSPRFYFYVLVRHAFLTAGLTDHHLADYVSGLMAKRVAPAPGDPLQDIAGGFTHASEFLAVISNAGQRMRFHLQVAAGNQFLLLTGLYPDFLKKRSEQSGAPDVGFYESFAQQAYRGAAENRQAPRHASRELLNSLSEAIPAARRSLNKVAEEFVFLG